MTPAKAGTNVAVTASKLNICVGEKITLTAIASGGLGGYSYSWYPSLTTLSSNSDITDAYPNPNGNDAYTVTVVDQEGCEAKDSIFLSMQEALEVSLTSPTHSNFKICHGLKDGVELKAEVCTTSCSAATIGTAPFAFDWSPNASFVSSNSNSETVEVTNPDGIESTFYTVKVTDANGCIGEVSQTLIVEPSAISVDVGNGTNTDRIWRCAGTTGIVNTAQLAHPGTDTYTWTSEPLGFGSTNKTPHAVAADTRSAELGTTGTPLVSTLYTITQTDANGCIGEGYIWLDIIEVNADIESFTNVCSQDPTVDVVLDAIPDESGYTYNWSAPSGVVLSPNSTAQEVTATIPVPPILASHTFDVTVTEIATSCTETASQSVLVVNGTCAPSKSVTDSSSSNSLSTDEMQQNIEMNGSVTLYPNPNTGQFQLKFSGELKDQIMAISILDLSGRVLSKQIKKEGDIVEFDMEYLPRGVYMIKMYNEANNLRMNMVID